jgi:hypothetical protein
MKNWHDVNKSKPPIATGCKALSVNVKVKTKHGLGIGYYNHIDKNWLVELYSDDSDELQSYTGVTHWKYIEEK